MIPEGHFAPHFSGITGTFRLNIEGSGSWLLNVEDGKLSILNSDAAAACTLTCREDDFVGMASGRIKVLAVSEGGRLRVEGDPRLPDQFLRGSSASNIH